MLYRTVGRDGAVRRHIPGSTRTVHKVGVDHLELQPKFRPRLAFVSFLHRAHSSLKCSALELARAGHPPPFGFYLHIFVMASTQAVLVDLSFNLGRRKFERQPFQLGVKKVELIARRKLENRGMMIVSRSKIS